MPVYVVDSNFFIQAHRQTYPLDIATGFWTKVAQLANTGVIVSIDKVRSEIYNNNDELKDWCKANLPQGFFKNSDEVVSEYTQVSTWARSRKHHYLPKALEEFLDADEADAFVVSYALADTAARVVVTQEVSEPNRRSKVKIPDCCIYFDVEYINTIELFRKLGETF